MNNTLFTKKKKEREREKGKKKKRNFESWKGLNKEDKY